MKLARLLLWATAPLAVSTLRHSSQRGVSRRDVPVPNGANVTSAKAVLGAISDQDWKKLRDKGCTLLQAMSASDEEVS